MKKMSSNKIVFILEIVAVIGFFLYYLIFITVPDYKKSLGSSDHFFNYSEYKSMYEFIYDGGYDFIIVLNNKRKVYHMMFFDKNSISLYNRKIEGQSLDDALKSINDIIGWDGLSRIVYYDSSYLSDLEKTFTEVEFISSTIEEKALSLGLNSNSDKVMLQDIDYYSKEIINKYNNSNKMDNSEYVSDDYFVTYCDNVYLKLEDYKNTNNISDLDSDNSFLLIETIPADRELKYYPSSNSWYYIKDNKIYAYIEFIDNNKKYGYCYNGSIDLKNEGMCG